MPRDGTVINSSPKKYGLGLLVGALVGADVMGLSVGEEVVMGYAVGDDVVGGGVVTISDSSQLDMSKTGLGVGGGVGAMTFQLDTSRANGLSVGCDVCVLCFCFDSRDISDLMR